MLAPLDNETIFKKAFTDIVVFQQFVKDLFNVDIQVDKIETGDKQNGKANGSHDDQILHFAPYTLPSGIRIQGFVF